MNSFVRDSLRNVCSLVTDGTHDTPKSVVNGFPLVKAKDIAQGKIDFNTCERISLEDHRKVIARSKPEKGDTLFVNIGASLGAAVYVNSTDEFSIKNVALFKPDPQKIVARYLYYLVISPRFQAEITSRCSGAAQPFLGLETLRTHQISYHQDKRIQTRIAAILSAYDDLIENNTRRIQILEEIVRRVYEEWFVCFRFPGYKYVKTVESELGLIPDNWRVGFVSDIATFSRGKSYTSSELSDTRGLPFVNLKCVNREGGFRNDGLKRVTGTFKETQKVQQGDIVVAITDMTQQRRIVARSARIPILDCDFGIISMDLVKMIPKTGYTNEYLYSLLRWSGFADEIKLHANGANVLHLLPERILEYQFPKPQDSLIREFTIRVKPVFLLLDVLSESNKKLMRTRDLLLPKLISGEIDVSNFPEPE